MNRPRPEPHTLAGAYALDAITGPDRTRFERHLARCQACAAELRELRETTARLAEAVAADLPSGLIERVIAAAGQTGQLPPVTRRARAVRRRVAVGLAAVSVAAAVISGAVARTAEDHLGAARLADHAVIQVLNAPDAVILTGHVEGGGTVTVVMSRRDRALVFTTAGLPTLPAGQCYQLWLMGPSGDRPASVLPAPDHGMTSPVIATGLTEGDWIGLTVEPAGQQSRTVPKPILMLSLAA